VAYFHPKMCFSTSFAKGFGANAAALVFPDEIQKAIVKNTGSTLIFSGPVPPVILAAGIASADIHLSEEIYFRQEGLHELIYHFNQKAKELDLPLVKQDLSPIRFIGIGADLENGFQIARGLQEDGFFVNIAAYPSVSLKNTGLRITLTLHLTTGDIDNLLYATKKQLDQKGVITEEVLNNFIPKELVKV
jgi:7-keto-8-aminopelargonate synthetase-like enzyme